ncbi:MAG: glutamine synthetase family protein [Chitinophagales bacterium]
MTLEEIISKIKDSEHNKVKVAVSDLEGILCGKFMHKEKFLSALEGGFGFCNVVFGWDTDDELYENSKITGWHSGYPDVEARIDPQTYRHIPWDNDVPFFLADFSREAEEDWAACPRSLLKRVRKKAYSMGYKPVFSQEFEWFNFEESPQSLEQKDYRNPKPMTPGMFGYSILRSSLKSEFFNDLFDLMEKFDVPLEGLHTETGPGVYEAAIRYGEILESADRAVLFKTGVKEIAYRHGIMASFMAKWNAELPGCSGHVHQSLWDEKGEQNLFYNEENEGISALMESFMAGQLACLPYILPMIAPTINSYKRLVEGAWAPTTLTWAKDNRTVALRTIPAGPKATRLENRVVGSDTNPYLAMSACLASGLYGIEQNLKLDSPETVGNGYKDMGSGKLPATLKEATAAMKNSEIPGLLFGEAFADHFVRTREWECQKFEQHVTDWELKRYFEII